MKVSREEKKQEAVKRMAAMGIYSETVKQFYNENLVSISEPPFGAFYWVDGKDLDDLRKWEEEHDALVYLVVRSYTEFGTLDSYLYVSDDKDEWELDRDDIKNGQQFAHVMNRDAPEFSEFGTIGIRKTVAAGIVRIW